MTTEIKISEATRTLLASVVRKGFNPDTQTTRKVCPGGIFIRDRQYDALALAYYVGEKVRCFAPADGRMTPLAVYSESGVFICLANLVSVSEVAA